MIRVTAPRRICRTCGEFLPHACAPVITMKRRPGGLTRKGKAGPFIIGITDREPG